jgi:hypothetical protein
MESRRQFLCRGAAGFLGTAGWAFGWPGETREFIPDGSQAKGMITSEAERAIERGLNYLQDRQPDDGSFGTNQYKGNVAVTSLGALAFIAGGHLPGRTPRGRVITKALEYVLRQKDNHWAGFLHNPDDRSHGPMYGHGFGTLFLAEVHGMVDEPKLRQLTHAKLKSAVELIIRSQNREGGWRYLPVSPDSDISVTICQIMALRAARNAGIYVPKSTVDRCVDYVKRCQDRRQGWFRYRLQDASIDNQSFARTAAGVAALYSAGIYTGTEIELALTYLMTHSKPIPGRIPRPDMYYFYGHYYAAQAMWTAGGSYWSEWFPAIRDELLQAQREHRDGSWPDQFCFHYGTAMACIILQIPNNYLPILQK